VTSNCEDTSRSANGWQKFKTIKTGGTKLLDKLEMKDFSLCFLEANDVIITFSDIISDESHFLSEFNPRTFQQRIFQDL